MITKQQIFQHIQVALEKLVEDYNTKNDSEVSFSVETVGTDDVITIDGGSKHGAWDITPKIEEL